MTLHAVAAGVAGKTLSPDEVAPGWTALIIVVALGVAVWFLWRSMNSHLSKVPSDFDEPGADSDAGEPEDGDEPDPIEAEHREQ